MLLMIGNVAASPSATPRREKQAAIPIEAHILLAHADGISQLDESERPRSHLPSRHHAVLSLNGADTARGIMAVPLSSEK
jgi:hypothetical protein